jgi:hypothetical protein
MNQMPTQAIRQAAIALQEDQILLEFTDLQ